MIEDRAYTTKEIAAYRIERPRHVFGWDDFGWIGQSDRRDAIRMYIKAGLHPIIVHGLRGDGSCTCGRAECSSAGKHPVRSSWQKEPLDVDTLDKMLISEWRYNVGLRTGR